MKIIRKTLSLVLVMMLLFASFAPAFADEEQVDLVSDELLLDGEFEDIAEPELLGEWKAGATSKDDISVSWTEGTLWFSGTGRMKDYDKPEDRPWNDCIGEISYVMLDDGIENIGKNAFAGLGKDLADEWDTADCFIPESLTEIGENAFADAKLYYMIEFCYPIKIASKAYQNAGDGLEVRFDAEPSEIADDAFEGCSGTIFTVLGSGWDTTKQYGGNFTYTTEYSFVVRDYYGDEENGCVRMLIPEGDETDYFATSWMDGYGFDHFEVVSGNFKLDDPTDPLINVALTDNVEINAFFKEGLENKERPEPETAPCPFAVTTADGQPAFDDVEGDYYWSEFSNAVILNKSGLTVSMAEGVESTSAFITASFSEDAEITLDNIDIEGTDIALSFMSNYPIKINLVGENKLIDTDGSWGFMLLTTSNVSFAGKGSLYISSNTNYAAVCSAELILLDGLKIKGSAEGHAKSGLKDVEYVQGTTGYDGYTYLVKGTKDVCRTLEIKAESILQSPILPIAIIIVLVAAVLIVRRKKK